MRRLLLEEDNSLIMTSPAFVPGDPRLAKLLAGEPLKFSARPTDREETPEEIAARTIPAKWLEDLAARPARAVGKPVLISNAIIAGPLDLQYARFEYELSITGTNFLDETDFSFATFKRTATFQGSRFARRANFRAAHAEADFTIAGTSFADGSSFQDLHVKEVLDAGGAKFGAVNFERIEVNKGAFFRSDDQGQRITFGGEASFLGAHIHGYADFSGAEFKAGAAFDGIQVGGSAFFRSDDKGQRVTFGGEASFLGAHIQGDADFCGAEFKAGAAFDGIHIDGDAFFRSDTKGQRVTFRGAAGFPSAVFNSDVQFIETEFKGDTDFDNAHFYGAAEFESAEFAAKTTLIGAKFERGTGFNSAKFGGEADFTAASGARDAYFLGTEFRGPVSFREARFQVVHFGQPAQSLAASKRWLMNKRPKLLNPTRFEAPVDLRGFTYDRIYVNLDELFRKLETTDRQPYTQLEDALRKVGADARANEVYLERRRVERKRLFSGRRLLRWGPDWLYMAVANYGIRPYRLLLYAFALVLLGAVLFSRPGALEPKDKEKRLAQTTGAAERGT